MAILLDLLRPVTDEELRLLSERNPGYQFERTADGRMVVSPTGGKSGRRSLKIAYQLERWNERAGLGVVFDSSTGFHLPDGSLLSPDALWMSRERWEALSPDEQDIMAGTGLSARSVVGYAGSAPARTAQSYMRGGPVHEEGYHVRRVGCAQGDDCGGGGRG